MKLNKLFLSCICSLSAVMAGASTIGMSQIDGVEVEFKLPQELDAIRNLDKIATITTDRPFYDIYWTVTSQQDTDFFHGGSCSASAGAGTYTVTAYTPSAEPMTLHAGCVYDFTFTLSEFGWDEYKTAASFCVTGAGAQAEQFSDVELTGFSGNMGPLGYMYKPKYTYTFSAPVYDVVAFSPQGMDGSISFDVKKADTQGMKWTVDVSSMANEEGAFELHVQARDLATGLRLLGNYGLDNSYICTIDVSTKDPNPDEDGGEDNPGGEDPGDEPIDEDSYRLQLGDNEVPIYMSLKAVFVAETDCKVLIEASDQYQVTYAGQTYAFTYIPTNWPANVCEIDGVKKGTAVMLTSNFVMNPLIRITTFESGEIIPVELHNSTPAVGTDGFWANNGILDITMNKPVKISGAQLVKGDLIADLEILHVSSSVSINLGNTLNTLLGNGSLLPGETFEVVLSDLVEASNPNNRYNGDGTLRLTYIAPQPQYQLISATVAGQELSTATLNAYSFLSYYAPDSEDGLFVLEFSADVKSVGKALLQMGNRDLDAQGKYYEGEIPVTCNGNKVFVDARGVLRTLNILFPAVVEEDTENGENTGEVMADFDTDHVTLRISDVIDLNGNYFCAQQAGNLGSFSFYMNYRELKETINLDGDNKMAGDEVWAGDEIRLWLSSADVTWDGIQINYMSRTEEEDIYETHQLMVTDYDVEADPYQGVIITFVLPEMPDVAAGQTVRVTLNNATSTDGMPHDLSIDYKAGDPQLGIHTIETMISCQKWTLYGTPVSNESKGLVIIGNRIVMTK